MKERKILSVGMNKHLFLDDVLTQEKRGFVLSLNSEVESLMELKGITDIERIDKSTSPHYLESLLDAEFGFLNCALHLNFTYFLYLLTELTNLKINITFCETID
ncbi:hypothetical protein J7K25_03240 [bacterium]|nr:hypothetical protein [bacterium]